MGKKTFAIADLHGRFDLLERALSAIESAAVSGTVVFLGDYVDRGMESRKVVERLMAGPPPGWDWITLKGNHEDMMVECLRGRAPLDWWLSNGGAQTLISYGQRIGDLADPAVVPTEHVEWLDSLPLLFVNENRVFVHAGVDPTVSLANQSVKTVLWMLYPDGFAEGHGGRHVVHGHHPFADGPLLLPGRTDLDTLAWYTGRLVVGVFDDEVPGGPTNLIEVLANELEDTDHGR